MALIYSDSAMSLLKYRNYNSFSYGSRQQFETESASRMLVLRLTADIALIIAFMILPWWFTLGCACALFTTFRRFWVELILIGLSYDVLYGAPTIGHWFTLQTTAIAVACSLIGHLVQSRLRT